MQAMFKCKFFLKSQENEKCEMNMMVGLKSEVCGSRQEVSGAVLLSKLQKASRLGICLEEIQQKFFWSLRNGNRFSNGEKLANPMWVTYT